jgi:aminotransferase EvaB
MNDLSRGIVRDRKILQDAFSNVLESSYVIMGPQFVAFEKSLAKFLNVASALGVASGTDALEISIKALMPAGKHSVLTAANAGGYSSVAARRAGFIPLYADVDAESHCVSLATVTAAMTEDVGVVVVTHLYGNLTEVEDIVDYCHKIGVKVVEDCAQAIGASLEGQFAGSFGDAGAFSFYPTKNLGALGDGGAIISNDPAVAQRVKELRQYGWTSKYEISTLGGVNSRLDELQAAFLLARLPLLEGFNERRREIIQRYSAAAQGSGLRILPAAGSHHVGHLAVATSLDRDNTRKIFLDHGVMTDIHFPVGDHEQIAFAPKMVSLPVTEGLTSQILSLPCFPELTSAEVDRVCAVIGILP